MSKKPKITHVATITGGMSREHIWFVFGGMQMTCCRVCGIMKRRDGENKPCPGPVRVGLRDSTKEEG